MSRYSDIVSKLINYDTEEEWFEFKENLDKAAEVGKYISALSNAAAYHRKDYGYLIWGVEDSSHEIVGTKVNYRKNINGELFEHFLARSIKPDIAFSFNEVQINGKRVVVLEIPKAKNVPTSYDKVRYLRIGSSRVSLTKHPDREAALFEILRDKTESIVDKESRYQDLTFERLFTYYAGLGITL